MLAGVDAWSHHPLAAAMTRGGDGNHFQLQKLPQWGTCQESSLGWYSRTSVLVGFRTCQIPYSLYFDEKKYFSTWCLLGTCRTCWNLNESWRLQDKMLHCSVLMGFSTHNRFRKELTMSTTVLCLRQGTTTSNFSEQGLPSALPSIVTGHRWNWGDPIGSGGYWSPMWLKHGGIWTRFPGFTSWHHQLGDLQEGLCASLFPFVKNR